MGQSREISPVVAGVIKDFDQGAVMPLAPDQIAQFHRDGFLYAAAECRADTSRWPSNYEPYVVAGITDESRIASACMPVVYPARRP